MLLTCPNCQNSYIVDDQLYAQQGGALCEQCQQPLVPMQNNGFAPQQGQWNPAQGQWDQQQAQWNQQQAQWNQQQAQWNQQSQWGQQQAQWNQQQSQWNQNALDAQWGQQPPADAQWGQQPPADAQWGQQPPADAQWGQQPPADAQWGQQPPTDAQWGQQPPVDAQWGQQPAGGSQWGSQAQWSQMADKPAPTEAFSEPLPPPIRHDGAGERTMAIDHDMVPPPPKLPMPAQPKGGDFDDGDDWGAWDDKPSSKPAPKTPREKGNSIEIGRPMSMDMRKDVTRAIDVQQLHKLYHDDVNPIAEFFKSLPLRYIIAAGAAIVVVIIGFSIAAYQINKPEEEVKKYNEIGDDVTGKEEPTEKTFAEIVRETKALSNSFMPMNDGYDVRSGSVLAATRGGIYYNGVKIAESEDVRTGKNFVAKIYDPIHADSDHVNEPIIFLAEGSLSMSAVYRILYSAGATSRRLVFGGTTTTGISTIEITPCEWPDHDLVMYGDGECKVRATLKLTKTEMILRGVDNASLGLTPEGEVISELRDEIIDTRLSTENIQDGFAYLRAQQGAKVRIDADGAVSFDIFFRSALKLYGDRNNPNVSRMYISNVPLI